MLSIGVLIYDHLYRSIECSLKRAFLFLFQQSDQSRGHVRVRVDCHKRELCNFYSQALCNQFNVAKDISNSGRAVWR